MRLIVASLCVGLAILVIASQSIVGAEPSTAYPPPGRVFLPAVLSSSPSRAPNSPAATATPAPTPTLSPSGCNRLYQGVVNPSFEEGFAGWDVYGFASLTRAAAVDGQYSVDLGGYNNSRDAVAQDVIVPDWAQTAALYASWYMLTTDPLVDDALALSVFDSNSNVINRSWVWNDAPQGAWYYTRTGVPNVQNYRGQALRVLISGFTDSSYPTSWYVDQVWLVFGCGSSIAQVNLGGYVGPEIGGRSTAPPGLIDQSAKATVTRP